MTPEQLDDLFRAGSDRGSFAPRPGEWKAMSDLLDGDEGAAGGWSRRVGAFWLGLFTLLIVGGSYGAWHFARSGPEEAHGFAAPTAETSLSDEAHELDRIASPVAAATGDASRYPSRRAGSTEPGPSNRPAGSGGGPLPNSPESRADATVGKHSLGARRSASDTARSSRSRSRTITNRQADPLDASTALSGERESPAHPQAPRPTSEVTLAPAASASARRAEFAERLRPLPAPISPVVRDASLPSGGPPPTTTVPFRPALAWELNVREDLTTVGLSQEVRSGTRFGVAALASVSPRLRARVGLTYGTRRYAADWASFTDSEGMFAGTAAPRNTDGSCRLLELPLSINLHPAGLDRSGWFVGAGLSLRYVLDESLDFTYKEGVDGIIDHMEHDVRRLDVGAGEVVGGYRFVGSGRLAWSIGPALEIPLSGIGYGEVDVYTLGVRVGLELR